MDNFYKTSLRVDEFIESLEMWERVYLWEVVNLKEAIVEISEEMRRQTSEYWDRNLDDYQRNRTDLKLHNNMK